MRILLGISGGIAAYKIPSLLRLLVKNGHHVETMPTAHALQFVTPLTLKTLSKNPVHLPSQEDVSNHVLLSRGLDLLLIAPATANIIGKLAHGLAGDSLSTTSLMATCPKLIIPSMHTEMWINPAVQDNIQRLRQQHISILGPDTGDLACDDIGIGRMADPNLIALAVEAHGRLSPLTSLQGKKILISSGGTQEAIDPVRVIGNRSSGQLGQMLAHLASFYGAEVTLISTSQPSISNPAIHVVLASSAMQVQAALSEHFPHTDILLMASAVSDFTLPYQIQKIKRSSSLTLSLESTPDILAGLVTRKTTQKIIGFCLSDPSSDLVQIAIEKLHAKGLDAIVANTTHNLGNPQREGTFIRKDHTSFAIGPRPILDFAHAILQNTVLL